MLLSSWLTLRWLVGWLFTLLMSATACLTLLIGRPVWGWLMCLKPWARGTLAIVGVKVDVVGQEHLRGPAVFVANHQSLIDVVFMPAILPTRTKFVVKKELKKIPLWGWMVAAAGGIPIDRKNPRAAIQTIREGLKHLPEGWSVVVFPEGTRSHDGRLKPFKKGAFHIAMESGLPMVPVALEGAYDVVHKKAVLINPGTVHVTVGAPIDTSTWRHDTLDEHVRDVWRAVASCLEQSRARHVASMRAEGKTSRTEGVTLGEEMPIGGNAAGGYGHSNVNAHS